MLLSVTFTILLMISASESKKINYEIPIAGLFTPDTHDLQPIFESVLRNKLAIQFKNRSVVLETDESLTALLNVNEITNDNKGVIAVIDTRKMYGYCDILCTVTNKYHLPYLTHNWRPAGIKNNYTLMYHPAPEDISKAYATLIIGDMRWDKFVMLYEDIDGLIRLQEILKSWPSNNKLLILRKLVPKGDNLGIFKEMESLGAKRFVVDCHVDNILYYVREIVQVNNKTDYESYVFTSLDTHTVDFSLEPKFLANVSTLHLTDRQDPYWTNGFNEKPINSEKVTVKTALIVDMINHLTTAIDNMVQEMEENGENIAQLPSLSSNIEEELDYTSVAWPNGSTLIDKLKSLTITGRTGNISFDENGRRIFFNLHYAVYTDSNGFVDLSYFNSATDSFINATATDKNNDTIQGNTMNKNKIFKVASKIGKPYFDIKNSSDEVIYEGFAVDLVDHIISYLNKRYKTNYSYEFYKVEGPGTAYENLANDLINQRADMVVCDFTITSERLSIIDFSTPFLNLGISILFQKPEKPEPDMFSFLNPLALEVWLILAITYLIVSLILVICARMSQGDWVNPHPCNRNPETLQNIWDLYNCTWFTMASIMTQGCDILPRAVGSRWVASIWYFFALIVTSSYTANMSSFLSSKRLSNDIKNVKDLAEQNTVTYGTVTGASTYKFFKNSNNSIYTKIFNTMETTRPSPYLEDNDHGLDRVLKGKNKFAFFMESLSIQYYTSRYPSLRMVGGLLDSKGYGIGLPKGSPYRGRIDEAILSLPNEIDAIQKKWWEQENNENSSKPKEEDDSSSQESLQMEGTSGIFLVLGIGVILGLLLTLLEFMLHARKIMVKEKVDFKTAFLSEWRSSLNPRSLSKPVKPDRLATPGRLPSPTRSTSRAVSVLRAATSLINFDDAY